MRGSNVGSLDVSSSELKKRAAENDAQTGESRPGFQLRLP